MVATYCGAPLCRPTRYYCNRQAEETVARPCHPRKSHVDDIIGLGLIQTFSHFLKEKIFPIFWEFLKTIIRFKEFNLIVLNLIYLKEFILIILNLVHLKEFNLTL